MNDYRAEQAAKTVALRSLVTDVAAELGDPWAIEPEQFESDGTPYFGRPLAYLTDGKGGRLMVEPNHKGRMEIRALFDNDRRVTYPESVTITVAQTRGATAIAREITRRVFPRYNEQREILAERVDKANGHDAAVYAVAYAMAATLDVPKPEQNGTGRYEIRPRSNRPGFNYGTITVSGDEFVRFDISVNADVALRMAAALAESQS